MTPAAAAAAASLGGPAAPAPLDRRWEAALSLRYQRRGERTVLAHRAHRGPLRVQRDLYPEGPNPCHTLVVHPPGGIAGGDDLSLDVRVEPAAAALLTTPGATKWYAARGHGARQRISLEVAAGGALEWLPQESIIFDGADAELSCRVSLASSAAYLGWEILCLGRQAAGERFSSGQLLLTTELVRDDRRLWIERGRLAGGDPLLTSPVGLDGAPVCATLVAVAPDPSSAPQPSLPSLASLPSLPSLPSPPSLASLLGACRAVDERGGKAGITCLPGGVLIARWLGACSEAARHYFIALWRLLRPALLRRAAVLPRIWAT